MAVKLRLRRMGKKKQPVYKIVAADARAPRDGKFLESIGLYNPKTDPATIDLDVDKALDWLRKGAQPTNTVKNLLSAKGVLLKKEMLKQGLTEEEVNQKVEEWSKAKEEKLNKKRQEKPVAKAKVEEKKAEEKKAEETAELKSEESTEQTENGEEKASE